MSIVAFDTLKFVHRLRDAGFPEPQAEAVAEAFKDAQGEAEVATKRDLAETESRVLGVIERVEHRLETKIAEVRSEIAGVRAEVGSEIAGVRSDSGDFRSELRLLEQRMTVKLGGMLLALAGILLAAIRYLPPHP